MEGDRQGPADGTRSITSQGGVYCRAATSEGSLQLLTSFTRLGHVLRHGSLLVVHAATPSRA